MYSVHCTLDQADTPLSYDKLYKRLLIAKLLFLIFLKLYENIPIRIGLLNT